MAQLSTKQLLNIQHVAMLQIASRILSDITPADDQEVELRAEAQKAVYRLMQHCEAKP